VFDCTTFTHGFVARFALYGLSVWEISLSSRKHQVHDRSTILANFMRLDARDSLRVERTQSGHPILGSMKACSPAFPWISTGQDTQSRVIQQQIHESIEPLHTSASLGNGRGLEAMKRHNPFSPDLDPTSEIPNVSR